MSTALTRLLAAVLLAAVVASLLWPLPRMDAAVGSSDKLIHAALFLVTAVCLGLLLPKASAAVAASGAVAVGGAAELLQGLVGRDPSWGDFAADVAGVAVFLLLAGLIFLLRARGSGQGGAT